MADFLQLWLGRHGQADDPDTASSDFERKLTAFGRHQVGQTARWLLSREEAPELILHSPLVRARQTAEAIAGEVTGGVVVMEETLLAPGFSTTPLLNRLKNAGVNRVVCIGHQPDIGHSLQEMTGAIASIPPGTLACIDFQGLVAVDTGALRWLADPAWFAG